MTSKIEYYMIKNWSQFQHYKNKKPTWIKLYNSLLSDLEFRKLRDPSKLLLVLLWLMGSLNENKFQLVPCSIRAALGIHNKHLDFTELIKNGYLVPYDPRLALDGIYRQKRREEKKKKGESLDKSEARQSARPRKGRDPARADRVEANNMVAETEDFVKAAGLDGLTGPDLIAGIRNYLKKGVKP